MAHEPRDRLQSPVPSQGPRLRESFSQCNQRTCTLARSPDARACAATHAHLHACTRANTRGRAHPPTHMRHVSLGRTDRYGSRAHPMQRQINLLYHAAPGSSNLLQTAHKGQAVSRQRGVCRPATRTRPRRPTHGTRRRSARSSSGSAGTSLTPPRPPMHRSRFRAAPG